LDSKDEFISVRKRIVSKLFLIFGRAMVRKATSIVITQPMAKVARV
jgi:hypothetical protein